MKINFTVFNNGQEHFVFDTDTLQPGETLDKFLINTDDNGKIYIVPMIDNNGTCRYPKDMLKI
jgi:hypothetical protein